KYEDIWEGDVNYFVGKGRFEQTFVPINTSGKILGTLEYQMCSDLTGKCVNYDEDFELTFSANENKPIVEESEIKEDSSLRGGGTTKQSDQDNVNATPPTTMEDSATIEENLFNDVSVAETPS